jgi:hypothetical protein
MFIHKFSGWMLFLLLVTLAVIGCHRGVRPVEELEDIPRMTKEDLRAKLGEPMIAIIDVRYTPNWKKSDRKIASAVREDPMELGSWTDRYSKDHILVLYCD